jgi:hypothetical protein
MKPLVDHIGKRSALAARMASAQFSDSRPQSTSGDARPESLTQDEHGSMPIYPDRYHLGGVESDCDSKERDYASNDDCDEDSSAEGDPRVGVDAADFRPIAWMLSGQ